MILKCSCLRGICTFEIDDTVRTKPKYCVLDGAKLQVDQLKIQNFEETSTQKLRKIKFIMFGE